MQLSLLRIVINCTEMGCKLARINSANVVLINEIQDLFDIQRELVTFSVCEKMHRIGMDEW